MSERSKLVDQFLAHAALYQEAASKSWNETIAVELSKARGAVPGSSDGTRSPRPAAKASTALKLGEVPSHSKLCNLAVIFDRLCLLFVISRSGGQDGHLQIDCERLVRAYETALITLQLSNRDDPITELIAKSIVNVTATGERDPAQIADRAINALGIRRPSAA